MNGFQLEERLTPSGTMSVRVNQENLGRESSIPTRENWNGFNLI